MINVGGIEMSLEGVLGLFVTAFGLWFVIKQLNETRLASQMEGMIALSQMQNEVLRLSEPLERFAETEKWQNMEPEEAATYVQSKSNLLKGHRAVQGLNELVGGLVKSGALDKNVAWD